MIAAIDFDVVAHLGNVRNVDLSQKGVYVVQLCLVYGNHSLGETDSETSNQETVAPVGLFSAPNTLDSFVKKQKIPAAPICHTCQVDDVKKLFRSRSFTIRYRDEIHELNEGVYWRFTLPKISVTSTDLDSNPSALIPFCEEILTIKFELLFAPLLEREGGQENGMPQDKADLMTEIQNFIPFDLPLESIASQSVSIRRVSSGLHEYVPIRFHCSKFIDLDCMIHCCATSIRYTQLSLIRSPSSSINSDKVQCQKFDQCAFNGGEKEDFSTVHTDGSSESNQVKRSQYYSPYTTTIQVRESEIEVDKSSISSSSIHFFSHIMKRLNIGSQNHPSMQQHNHETADSSNSDDNNIIPSDEELENSIIPMKLEYETSSCSEEVSSQPSQHDINTTFRIYSAPLLLNYLTVTQAMDDIIDVNLPTSAQTESPISPTSSTSVCKLVSKQAAILDDLYSARSEKEVVIELQDHLDSCNAQLTMHWNMFLSACKRSMQEVNEKLKATYVRNIRKLWRRQILVQTKSLYESNKIVAAEDHILLTIMQRKISLEERYLSDQLQEHSLSKSNGPNQLRVFNADIYSDLTKLPFAILQQYVDLNLGGASVNANSSALVNSEGLKSCGNDALKEEQSVSGTITLTRGGKLLGVEDKEYSTYSKDSIAVARYDALSPLQLDVAQVAEIFAHNDHLVSLEVHEIEDRMINPVKRQLVTATSSRAVSWQRDNDLDNKAMCMGSSLFDSPTRPTKVVDISLPFHSINNKSPEKCSSSTSSVFSPSVKVLHGYTEDNSHHVESESVRSCLSASDDDESDVPVHLIVMQHGFLGSSYDLRLLQNAVSVELPEHTHVLCAKSNEEHTQDSIAQMGKRLSFEIIQYCKDKCPSILQPFTKARISFVGHSMGGLIIRFALQEPSMKVLYKKLHAFISLATPHLGTLFSDSQIVSTGMWALFQVKKCKALKELVLEDGIHGKVKKSLLYKLSSNGVLSLFKRVILVSSTKDQYVPAYSARVQLSPKIVSDVSIGAVIEEMSQNVLRNVKANQLIRVIIDNNVGDAVTMNTVIGRAAHISYLENPVVATQLFLSLYPYLV